MAETDNRTVLTDLDIARKVFEKPTRGRKPSPVKLTIQYKKLANIKAGFLEWLMKVPGSFVFNYWETGECPMARYVATIFPEKQIIGDRERVWVCEGGASYTVYSVPEELEQAIHGCAEETNGTCVIQARKLKKVLL
jgi:hypothetical protein